MTHSYRSTAIALALPIFSLAIAAGLAASSGPKPGQMVTPFNPVHVTGADKGTSTCPVCKYGGMAAVQVWVNEDDMSNVAKIAKSLESDIAAAGGPMKLKAFVVFIKPQGASDDDIAGKLKALAEQDGLQHVALVYVNGKNDGAVSRYRINTDDGVKNTVFVYARRKVVANYVNLKGDEANLDALAKSVTTACQAN